MFRTLLATTLFVTAFIGVVQAQDRKEVRAACLDDTKKFCADVQRGGGRIIKCLREHSADLAAPCRDGLASLKKQ